jgi:hypothetical protein
MPKKPARWIIIGVGILLAVFIGLTVTWIIAPPMDSSLLTSVSTANNAPTINEISCDSMEHFNFHIHAHLDIFINGNPYSVPSEIGIIPNQCIYWMHTHDDSGIIHIESPENRTFTLGEFFDIWGEKFDNNQVFDNIVGQGSGNNNNNLLSIYINGKRVSNSTDYREIKINSHDEIAIIYGAPPDSIPASYKFPKGL